MLLTFGVVFAPNASAAGSSGCTPVGIMTFRGSNEQKAQPVNSYGVVSDGWEGDTLKKLINKYAALVNSKSPALSSVPVIGVSANVLSRQSATGTVTFGYPAANVPGAWGISFAQALMDAAKPGAAFGQSVVDGEAAALQLMYNFDQQQPANCPNTKWILLGYSQGAMVARAVFNEAPSRVASMYMVADPLHIPGMKGDVNFGRESAPGKGVISTLFRGDAGTLFSSWNNVSDDSVNWCLGRDLVCDYESFLNSKTYSGSTFNGLLQHGDYFGIGSNNTVVTNAAEALRLQVQNAVAANQSSSPYAGNPVAKVDTGIAVTGNDVVVTAARNSSYSRQSTFDYDLNGDYQMDVINGGPSWKFKCQSDGYKLVGVVIHTPGKPDAANWSWFNCESYATAYPYRPAGYASAPFMVWPWGNN